MNRVRAAVSDYWVQFRFSLWVGLTSVWHPVRTCRELRHQPPGDIPAIAALPSMRLVPSEFGGLLPRTPALTETFRPAYRPVPEPPRAAFRATVRAMQAAADEPVRAALIAAGWPPDGAYGAV